MFLAIDTSSQNISLAIVKNGKVIVDDNRRMRFGALSIVARLERYLKKHKLALEDFNAFIVGYGPGSFTGLRISFAMMKALNLALNKPIITVSSLWAPAQPFFKNENKIAVVADARKNLVYCARFDNGRLKGREKLITLKAALEENRGAFFVTYDPNIRQAAKQDDPKINFCAKDVYPKAVNLLAEGMRLYRQGKFTPLERLEPLYLHPKDCQVRK